MRECLQNTWYDLRLDAVGNELRAVVMACNCRRLSTFCTPVARAESSPNKTAAEYVNYLAWQP